MVHSLSIQAQLVQRIKDQQKNDSRLRKIFSELDSKPDFWVRTDGALVYRGGLFVPRNKDLIDEILEEAHRSRYAVHPGRTKMYRNLKQTYWWNDMKK